jgi:hypothetical protein
VIDALQVAGVALGLLLVFLVLAARNPKQTFRSIPAFKELKRTIELSVEDGSRMHISLGRGGLLGPQSAAAFAGLTLLRQVADIAADSDQPPVATSGDGTLMLLAQDTLRATYQRLGIANQYSPRFARLTGMTPFSYAGGTLPLVLDRTVSANLLVGSFGEEVALIGAAGQQSGTFGMGGGDTLNSQAVLFGSAQAPLIGEELFATGAYLDAGPAHKASLRMQDVLRWIVILLFIFTAVMPMFTGQQ